MAIRGLDRLRRKLVRMLPGPGAAADAANEAMRMIKKRTISGKDRHGRRFRPYAQATVQDRKERGRQTAHVDLVDKGHMLAAMIVRRRGKNSAEITFANAQEMEKALGHQKGVGRLPKREFFGLGKEERKAIAKVIRNAVGKA